MRFGLPTRQLAVSIQYYALMNSKKSEGKWSHRLHVTISGYENASINEWTKGVQCTTDSKHRIQKCLTARFSRPLIILNYDEQLSILLLLLS